MATVTVDKEVPNFIAQATSGKDVLLSALKGWNVVFYFYPKDNTPGCTTESIDFKEYYQDLKNNKTLVFGVSKDSLKSHEAFKAEHQLPFELISDTEGRVCELFDVIRPQSFQGQSVLSMERSTFLIDANGILKQEWRKVRVNGHVEAVVEAVEALVSQA